MNANDCRRFANQSEERAKKWKEFATNTSHPEEHRIIAARQYRERMKDAVKWREMAETRK